MIFQKIENKIHAKIERYSLEYSYSFYLLFFFCRKMLLKYNRRKTFLSMNRMISNSLARRIYESNKKQNFPKINDQIADVNQDEDIIPLDMNTESKHEQFPQLNGNLRKQTVKSCACASVFPIGRRSFVLPKYITPTTSAVSTMTTIRRNSYSPGDKYPSSIPDENEHVVLEDADVPSYSSFMNINDANQIIDINELNLNLPKLPVLGSPLFTSNFQSKLRVCSYCCHFSQPNQRLITSKTLYLNEILRFLMNNNVTMDKMGINNINSLLEMIHTNLFRKFQISFAISDFEGSPPIHEPAWAHVSICYDILKILITKNLILSTKYGKLRESSNQNFHEENDKMMKKIIRHNMKSPDANERKVVCEVAALFYNDPNKMRYYLDLLLNILVKSTDPENLHQNPRRTDSVLYLLSFIFQKTDISVRFFEKIFIKYILPLLHHNQFDTFENTLIAVIKILVGYDCSRANLIIADVLRYWPATKCKKQAAFLTILLQTLPICHETTIYTYLPKMLSIFSECIISMNEKVSLAALSLWQCQSFEDIVNEKNALHDIVRKLAGSVRLAAHTHWSQAVRKEAKKIMITFTKSGLSKAESFNTKYDTLKKNWTTIARMANNNDKSISLPVALGRITAFSNEHFIEADGLMKVNSIRSTSSLFAVPPQPSLLSK